MIILEGFRASATLSVVAGGALGFGGLCHFSFCLPKKKSNQKKRAPRTLRSDSRPRLIARHQGSRFKVQSSRFILELGIGATRSRMSSRASAIISVVAGSALGFAGPSVGVRVAKPTALEAMTGPSGPGAAKNQDFAGKQMNGEEKVDRRWFNFQKIAWAALQDHVCHRVRQQ